MSRFSEAATREFRDLITECEDGEESLLDYDVVRDLLDRGADFNAQDPRTGNTALQSGLEMFLFEHDPALFRRTFDTIFDFPEARIDLPNAQGQSLIHLLLELRTVEYLGVVLRDPHGRGLRVVDLKDRGPEGNAPLHYACDSTELPLEKARLLLDAGANVNTLNDAGASPLNRLMGTRWVPTRDIAQLLIDRGADTNLQDADGMAPLHNAIRHGRDRDVVELLLSVRETRLDDLVLEMAQHAGMGDLVADEMASRRLERQLAFGQGLHPRLGKRSLVHGLNCDVLGCVFPHF